MDEFVLSETASSGSEAITAVPLGSVWEEFIGWSSIAATRSPSGDRLRRPGGSFGADFDRSSFSNTRRVARAVRFFEPSMIFKQNPFGLRHSGPRSAAATHHPLFPLGTRYPDQVGVARPPRATPLCHHYQSEILGASDSILDSGPRNASPGRNLGNRAIALPGATSLGCDDCQSGHLSGCEPGGKGRGHDTCCRQGAPPGDGFRSIRSPLPSPCGKEMPGQGRALIQRRRRLY